MNLKERSTAENSHTPAQAYQLAETVFARFYPRQTDNQAEWEKTRSKPGSTRWSALYLPLSNLELSPRWQRFLMTQRISATQSYVTRLAWESEFVGSWKGGFRERFREDIFLPTRERLRYFNARGVHFTLKPDEVKFDAADMVGVRERD